MLNLRVEGLIEMAEALEAAGITVERRAEWDMPGRPIMRIHDSEGLPIELWEPAA